MHVGFHSQYYRDALCLSHPAQTSQQHLANTALVAAQLSHKVEIMQNTYLVFCWASCEACKNRPRAAHAGTKRYAIIGGGFAGAATAHYLAATASVVRPVTIHLYDIAGLVSNINVLHSCSVMLCLNLMGQIVSCPVCRLALPFSSVHVTIHSRKDSMWSLDIGL